MHARGTHVFGSQLKTAPPLGAGISRLFSKTAKAYGMRSTHVNHMHNAMQCMHCYSTNEPTSSRDAMSMHACAWRKEGKGQQRED